VPTVTGPGDTSNFEKYPDPEPDDGEEGDPYKALFIDF